MFRFSPTLHTQILTVSAFLAALPGCTKTQGPDSQTPVSSSPIPTDAQENGLSDADAELIRDLNEFASDPAEMAALEAEIQEDEAQREAKRMARESGFRTMELPPNWEELDDEAKLKYLRSIAVEQKNKTETPGELYERLTASGIDVQKQYEIGQKIAEESGLAPDIRFDAVFFADWLPEMETLDRTDTQHKNAWMQDTFLKDSLPQAEISSDGKRLRSIPNELTGACEIPEGVKRIEKNAFSEGCALTSLTLPASLAEIDEDALAWCTLEEIRVAEGNEHFKAEDGVLFSADGKKIIYCCRNKAHDYTVPDGVTEIGPSAFFGCRDLSSVTLPESLTQIGPRAFADCEQLTAARIPQNVTRIGERAFFGCRNLTSTNIPEGVTRIEKLTFARSSLSILTLSPNLTHILDGAFAECPQLEYVQLPENLTYLGRCAFAMCENLAPITIPAKVSEIGDGVFFGCGKMREISISSQNPHFKTEDGVLFSADGKTLLQFPGRKGGQFYVPDGVTEIRGAAFAGCVNLRAVRFPESVTRIGNAAFAGCSALENMTLPRALSYLGKCAFIDCTHLNAMRFPDSLTRLEDGMFANCCALQRVTLSAGMEEIGSFAFHRCRELRSAAIPDSLTRIGRFSFFGCVNLHRLALPEGLTEIGDGAFCDCFSLSTILLPKSLIRLGNCAFAHCASLNEIILPDGLTEIGDFTFYLCDKLHTLHIPESVTKIGKFAITSLSQPIELTIPANVQEIHFQAIRGCGNLTLLVEENSEAHRYAARYRIKFRLLPKEKQENGGSSQKDSENGDTKDTKE